MLPCKSYIPLYCSEICIVVNDNNQTDFFLFMQIQIAYNLDTAKDKLQQFNNIRIL